jgi:hypothetical protein
MIIKCACLCAAFRDSKEEDMATKSEVILRDEYGSMKKSF